MIETDGDHWKDGSTPEDGVGLAATIPIIVSVPGSHQLKFFAADEPGRDPVITPSVDAMLHRAFVEQAKTRTSVSSRSRRSPVLMSSWLTERAWCEGCDEIRCLAHMEWVGGISPGWGTLYRCWSCTRNIGVPGAAELCGD